jgi:fatty acid desaturase
MIFPDFDERNRKSFGMRQGDGMARRWKTYGLGGGGADGAADLDSEAFESRVEQEWFSCKIDRKALKQLTKRSDGPPLRHFGLWLGLLILSGVAGFLTWGSWWCVLPFAVYGVLYAAADHRAHELSHGTPFKTRWINEVLYQLAAFMALHEGYYWRWSHSRHHTHTIIVGRDPEIAVQRPPGIVALLLDLFFIKSGLKMIAIILRNATGSINADGRHFIPTMEVAKVVWSSRIYVAIFAATIAACLFTHSILPAMFIVLPRFYGGPLSQVFNITQHTGLDEDVYDHRLNTRTVLMNPAFNFLYMHMNYHIEHHMFPMVPFYALPELHERIKDQCPAPYANLRAAYAEIIPALLRQRRDPSWFLVRQLSGTATEDVRVAVPVPAE